MRNIKKTRFSCVLDLSLKSFRPLKNWGKFHFLTSFYLPHQIFALKNNRPFRFGTNRFYTPPDKIKNIINSKFYDLQRYPYL